jgi:putative DNA primase/helicase
MKTGTPVLNIVRLSDVELEEVSWFWEPYLPLGKIILLDGDPSCGKTYLALKIAAAVTTRDDLPQYGAPMIKHKPANVLFMTGEDALGDTIKPRFAKVGGDDSKFFVIQGLIVKQDGEDLQSAISLQHIPQLTQAMETYKPKLWIVDPFSAFLGADVDLHRDNEMRPILERIGKLAEKHKCAVILIRHLNKSSLAAQYRGMGSIAISASARSILLAAKDPRPEELGNIEPGVTPDWSPRSRNVIIHVKSNITQKGSSFGYSIGSDGLAFTGTNDLTEDDVLNPAKTKTPRQTAMAFIQQQLSDGAKPVKDLQAAGLTLGFSAKTLDRASNKLDIAKGPIGFGGGWYWAMTAEDLALAKEPKASVN